LGRARGTGAHDYRFGIVGPGGGATHAQGVVVVVQQEQPPVSEWQDALYGLKGERERVTKAGVALTTRLGDAVRVPDREQVEHFLIDQIPFGILTVQVYLVDPPEARFLALIVVTLDREKATDA